MYPNPKVALAVAVALHQTAPSGSFCSPPISVSPLSRNMGVWLHAAEVRGGSRIGTEGLLLSEFVTASGEVVNPYQILKVPRTADQAEIKMAYRTLSRKYHPDGMLQRKDQDILPGRWYVKLILHFFWLKIVLYALSQK